MLICCKHLFPPSFCSVVREPGQCLIWLEIDLSAAKALLLIVVFLNFLFS
jgi:hypothetical protein